MKDLQAMKDAARAKRDERREDFRWLMADVRGRRLVYGWLKEARVLETTYDPAGVRDVAADMAYSEGRKVFGYRLLREILKEAPEALNRMIKENTNG